MLTYAAGWGYGIVNGTPVPDEAAALLQHLIAVDTAVEGVKTGFWFLSDRKSVLEAAEDRFPATGLKMYSAANAIGIRPFHPRYVEALTIIEDTASAYLTNQMTLEESMAQASTQLAALE